jgi:phage shock protein A
MGLIAHIGMMSTSKPYERVTEDPEKILEQSINDMQEDLVRFRQAVAESIAALKLQEEQYNESATQAQESEKRAILAIQKGEENLARELLSRKKTHADLAATLKAGLDQQSVQVETLKKNLIAYESTVSEAETKKEMLKAQFLQAKTQENLNNILG